MWPAEPNDVERRIDLAFAFLSNLTDHPELLELVPDNAIVAVGDEYEPSFTERSRQLLVRKNRPAEDANRPQILIVRSKRPRPPKGEPAPSDRFTVEAS